MEIARHLVLLLHLVGFAALLGGCLVQLSTQVPEVNAAMLQGALIELMSGIALLVLLEVGDGPVPQVKLGIKLVITVIITLLVVVNRKYESIPRGLWGLLLILTFANAAISVLW